MFSGIISSTGSIVTTASLGQGTRLTIDAADMDLTDVRVGDSIAVDGVCLTVIDHHAPCFVVDVSAETLRCTKGFFPSHAVNLERALQLSARLDGHIVTGHVDGVGVVTQFHDISESWHLEIEAPLSLAKYIAAKGSIAVNGVSLTTNQVAANRFCINLIPHTVSVTTFNQMKVGDRVNLEVDIFARYIERMLEVEKQAGDEQ